MRCFGFIRRGGGDGLSGGSGRCRAKRQARALQETAAIDRARCFVLFAHGQSFRWIARRA
jgi:hypothetical protein